jgi:hypothetical protein
MRKLTVSCLLFLAIAAVALFAADRGPPDEAKAMLQKAIAHYKCVGRKQALADFNAKKPPFGDRDLYVVCIGPDHTIVANGGFPRYVGMSADFDERRQWQVDRQGWLRHRVDQRTRRSPLSLDQSHDPEDRKTSELFLQRRRRRLRRRCL